MKSKQWIHADCLCVLVRHFSKSVSLAAVLPYLEFMCHVNTFAVNRQIQSAKLYWNKPSTVKSAIKWKQINRKCNTSTTRREDYWKAHVYKFANIITLSKRDEKKEMHTNKIINVEAKAEADVSIHFYWNRKEYGLRVRIVVWIPRAPHFFLLFIKHIWWQQWRKNCMPFSLCYHTMRMPLTECVPKWGFFFIQTVHNRSQRNEFIDVTKLRNSLIIGMTRVFQMKTATSFPLGEIA